jgi:pimeloyl-ACP methyl ester carboxylesterase
VEPVRTDAVEDTGVEKNDERPRRIAPRARSGQDADEVPVGAELQRLLVDHAFTASGHHVPRARWYHRPRDSKRKGFSLKVLHFGPAARRLLGALHTPGRLRQRSAAVLLCNPFGEEAARAHRIYRVLATQLERSGYPVLRFDYGGTGDSMGDSEDTSLTGWLDDVEVAADELRRAAGNRKLVVVGVRLGATIAGLASARGGARLRHLVLWDPVVDGPAYLRELTAAHRAYMRHELGAAWHAPTPASADGAPTESLGTPITPALAADLAAIDLAGAELRSDHVTVISTAPSPPLERLRQHLGSSGARWIDQAESPAWNSDAALNASVVPMDIVQAVVTRIEEVSP